MPHLRECAAANFLILAATMNKFKAFSIISILLCLILYNLAVRNAPIKSPCPEGVILTVKQGGNSSNNLWEYLSVVSLSRLYPEKGFRAYIPDGMKEVIEEMFAEITANKLSELPFQCINYLQMRVIHRDDPPRKVQRIDPRSVSLVVLEKYSARYEEILAYGVENVKRELRFHREDVKSAMETLEGIKRKFSLPEGTTPTYIGVHYRGGDYLPLLRKAYRKFKGASTYRYYRKAMRYLEGIYENVIFVLVTADKAWLRRNLGRLRGRVAVSPYVRDKARDMALLAHCNHSVINYGTFGVTGALLGGGTTVAYDLGVPLDHRGMTLAMGIADTLNNWKLMK